MLTVKCMAPLFLCVFSAQKRAPHTAIDEVKHLNFIVGTDLRSIHTRHRRLTFRSRRTVADEPHNAAETLSFPHSSAWHLSSFLTEEIRIDGQFQGPISEALVTVTIDSDNQ